MSSRARKAPAGTVGSVDEDWSDGPAYLLYDRSSGRYVAAGGALTVDPRAAIVFRQAVAPIRLLARGSCEPWSLVAIRVAPPVAARLAAAG